MVNQSEPQQTSLADIAKMLAGGDEKVRNFHAKAFSFILPDPTVIDEFAKRAAGLSDATPNKHPVALLKCDLSTLDLNQGTFLPYVDEEGRLLLHLHRAKMNFIQVQQLLFVSPFSVVDGASSYERAFEAISFVRAILALYFGRLAAYTKLPSLTSTLMARSQRVATSFGCPCLPTC